jgi:hypothetical protein
MKKSLAVGMPAVVLLCLLWVVFRPQQPEMNHAVDRQRENVDPPVIDLEAVRLQVETFCGDCHATPSAANFPREAWAAEVKRGFNFYFASGRTDLVIPPIDPVVEYFRRLAPEKLAFSSTPGEPGESQVEFRKEPLRLDPQPVVPATSHVSFVRSLGGGAGEVLLCDMFAGEVGLATLTPEAPTFQSFGSVSQPCHVEPTDLDQDGRIDYVAASLGSFRPEDHDQGQVVWLRTGALSASGFEVVVLQSGLGRVADVRPADFDGDRDMDLVVAEFGYLKTGRILLLENISEDQMRPAFRVHVLDGRHGTIHLPVVDLNGDGRPDFVALISQEHEVTVAFLNEGNCTFRQETIFSANEPSYGSNGIQLVDFDLDGDIDLAYTNGDTLDSHFLKPYHSIQWLENAGSFPWTHHHVAWMPGVARALAADLDNDGDHDIAAVAFFPANLQAQPGADRLDAVCWFEQIAPGRFARHELEVATTDHMSLETADIDGDGDTDLIVGNYAGDPGNLQKKSQKLTLWRNQLKD